MRRFRIIFVIFFGLCIFLTAADAAETRFVDYVIDGDTIILDHREKVRLIGVDTPEINDSRRNLENAVRRGIKPRVVDDYAYRAKTFVRKEFYGRQVRVEYDRERKDKYGRTLAYIYREPDNLFLNAELIKQGYGFAYTRFLFRRADEFRAFEKAAKETKQGLWQ